MITIDCRELSTDEQLALAAAISDALQGRCVALKRDNEIVVDNLLGQPPEPVEVEAIVRRFIGKRRQPEHYSVERKGDTFVVHAPDPVAAGHAKRKAQLPENLMKCPLCGFVSPYEEMYNIHLKSHGLGG